VRVRIGECTVFAPYDAHCCHMGTASLKGILFQTGLGHSMLYSCRPTHMATVGVKGLRRQQHGVPGLIAVFVSRLCFCGVVTEAPVEHFREIRIGALVFTDTQLS